jgi:predicted transcriptional regulator
MSDDLNLIDLTADVVSAHVSNNSVAVGDLPNLIRQVHEALSSLGRPEVASEQKQERTPAVSIRSSIKPDHLVCLECGKKQKTLKRHVQNAHGMSPAEYRAAFGLKKDYPMVAPEYSQRRGDMARSIGLGRRKSADAPSESSEDATKPKGRGRSKKDASE